MFEVSSTVGSRLGARQATRHELKIAKVCDLRYSRNRTECFCRFGGPDPGPGVSLFPAEADRITLLSELDGLIRRRETALVADIEAAISINKILA